MTNAPSAPVARRRFLLGLTSVLVLSTAAACGKPEKPVTGAPVAFEVRKVDARAKTIELRAYNFSDKTLGGYQVLLRYKDGAGKVLKVEAASRSEKDFDTWSFSGLSYKARPKMWTPMTLDRLDIPAGAANAEVLLRSAQSVAPDGIRFDREPAWEMPYPSAWPGTS